jgi:hypothetical protein
MFTRSLHWSLSWARSIQSIPPHHILRSMLILSSHLRLGLPSSSFLLAFPPKFHMHSASPHSCYMPCPSHTPWLDHSNYTCEEYKLWSSSLCSFLQPPVTSSLFGPNILLNTLVSNSESMILPKYYRPSFTPTQNHTQNYSFENIIFKFLDSRREDERFWNEW